MKNKRKKSERKIPDMIWIIKTMKEKYSKENKKKRQYWWSKKKSECEKFEDNEAVDYFINGEPFKK